MATSRGLLVPVVRNADAKSITDIAVEITDLADRARNKNLKPDEMEAGTFTVSNQGGIGGTQFAPIVFWPQVAILGVGGMMRRIYDPTVYDFLKPFQPMNEFITINAMILGFAQFLLVWNFVYSWYRGRAAKRNPWRANTLEWAAPSPPPHGNFDVPLQVYRGPYEYSSPESVQDFLPQYVSPEDVAAQRARHEQRLAGPPSIGGGAE